MIDRKWLIEIGHFFLRGTNKGDKRCSKNPKCFFSHHLTTGKLRKISLIHIPYRICCRLDNFFYPKSGSSSLFKSHFSAPVELLEELWGTTAKEASSRCIFFYYSFIYSFIFHSWFSVGTTAPPALGLPFGNCKNKPHFCSSLSPQWEYLVQCCWKCSAGDAALTVWVLWSLSGWAGRSWWGKKRGKSWFWFHLLCLQILQSMWEQQEKEKERCGMAAVLKMKCL